MNEELNSGYNPTIVNMAKAIGQKESGGDYNKASPDPGSSPSAYQFTPGFIDTYAPKYLKDYSKDTQGYSLSPEQQDELAYQVINGWKSNGIPGYEHLGKPSFAQIASAWNSGDPDAYLDENYKGINKSGNEFNVPQYVNDVKDNYERLSSPVESGDGIASQLTDKDKAIIAGGAGVLGAGAVLAGGALAGGAEAAAGGATGGLGNAIKGLVSGIGTKIKGIPEAAGQQLLGGVVQKAVSKAVSEKEGQIAQPGTQSLDLSQFSPQETESSNNLAQSLMKSLQQTPTGRVLAQDPNTESAIKANAKYGFSPELVDGNMDFSSSIENSNRTIKRLNESIGNSLEGEMSPIEQVREEAKQTARQYVPSNLWEDTDKSIDKEIDGYASRFADENGNISHKRLQQMKQEMWSRQQFDTNDTVASKAAKKQIGFAARSTIMRNTLNPEFYKAAMAEEQNLINGQKIMNRLNGKKAPEFHSFAKSALTAGGRYAAMYIGDKIGGPMGAVLGDMVGRYITGEIEKSHGKTIFDTPQMRNAIDQLQKDSPEYYKLLVDALKKKDIDADVGSEAEEKVKEITGEDVSLSKEEAATDRAKALIRLDPKDPHYEQKKEMAYMFLNKSLGQLGKNKGLVPVNNK